MDKTKVYKRGGQNMFRVIKVFNLKINKEFIHDEYKLIYDDSNELADTGLLVVFQIIPKNDNSLPFFKVRWDQNCESLDVDIIGVSSKINKYFKSGTNGYKGHHTKLVMESPRLFNVNINTPKHKVFEGNVSFNISHGHEPGIFNRCAY